MFIHILLNSCGKPPRIMKLRLTLLFAFLMLKIPGFCSGPGVDKESSVKLIHAECKIFYLKTTVEWSTEFEKVNCDFIIESSLDGKNWLIEGKVKSHGKTDHMSDYYWEDNRNDNIRYYRIRQLDPSGFHVLAELQPENYSIEVTIQQVNIDYERKLNLDYTIDKDQELIVRVYDRIGEQVLTLILPSETAGDYIYPVDISYLPRGNYLLEITQVLSDKTVAEKQFSIR